MSSTSFDVLLFNKRLFKIIYANNLWSNPYKVLLNNIFYRKGGYRSQRCLKSWLICDSGLSQYVLAVLLKFSNSAEDTVY